MIKAMDTNEKIIRFNTLEELEAEIIKDSTSNDMLARRYSVRFIMLNNFNAFQELSKFFADFKVKRLNIESLIDDDDHDQWITTGKLKRAIQDCQESTFVAPFSELTRFYKEEDFRGFFNDIMLLEDVHNPHKRIYMPLIGLHNRFVDFLNHFGRLEESAPIWRLDAEPQHVEVYFTKYKDFKLPHESVQCQLNTLYEWLTFWKKQAPQSKLVCTSKTLANKYKHSKPDDIFHFELVKDAYQFMTMFLDLQFPAGLGYSEDDNAFWEELLMNLENSDINTFSLDTFIRKQFNVLNFTTRQILDIWSNEETSRYQRWLLKAYVLNYSIGNDNPYLLLCVKDVPNLTDADALANMIVDRLSYDVGGSGLRNDLAKQRRLLITSNADLFRRTVSKNTQEVLKRHIIETYQVKKDFEFAQELCTGVFDFENQLLMGWFANHSSDGFGEGKLQGLYPDLYNYLQPAPYESISDKNNWITDYFQAYKHGKIQDNYPEVIRDYIKEQNANNASFYKWYHSLKESHDYLTKLNLKQETKIDKIYWIDGLGAEFYNYILYRVKQEHSDYEVVISDFSRATIPSSTHHNRFEGELVARKFEEIDALGHDVHGYNRYTTLPKELEIINQIIHDIISYNKNQHQTIAIVSDHGLSYLSRHAESRKYSGKIEHDGRYIQIAGEADNDSDYIIHTNEHTGQKYKVALTHSSLGKKPVHQVHGGCTPEEVIVPFVIISNKGIKPRSTYKVSIVESEIPISAPTVKFSIMPEPSSAFLEANGKEIQLERIDGKWTAEIPDATEGEQLITIKPENGVPVSMKVKFIGFSGSSIDDLLGF